ncbi:uncharacterized protein Z518_00117 [Rhinocladiella mackenziei CBS 650.93]|uniref:Phenylacetyl-CoA ligase n=1 Tax=Rhinocladiella mackenziei CBS 650.93 TaxID=1442369 RepID=A0A0D2ISU7_9EURO|nr:uncharacterized protein Z518_00117 [Rhinocladiella mackenziei CBS 650.93]KIX09039.1 hypothetical protein Z518_00117 [Rhinocladiella mackenziei CBS 650.93]
MPLKSRYPDVQFRETDLFSFVFDRQHRPCPENKVIFQDASEPSLYHTFAQVRDRAVEFGLALRDRFQFSKHDVLALYSPNNIDVPCLVFGTLWAGGVVSPANPAYTVDELAYQLNDSGAKVLVSHISTISKAKVACAKVGIPEARILVIGNDHGERQGCLDWKSFQARTNALASQLTATHVTPKEDLAFLAYSSGTTGRPKGVMLTHFNVTANIQQVRDMEVVASDNSISVPGIPDAPSSGDKILACLPFFHIYGLTSMMINPLFTGVQCLVMEKFEIEAWCRAVQDHRVTVGYIVPPIVLLLCKHPAVEKYDLSSLRMTTSGAAPLTRELVEAAFKRKGVRVKQGYGLTETSPALFVTKWDDWNRRFGTTGELIPNVLAKICDPSEEGDFNMTHELPIGQTGELYVKGPNVFHGYHNNLTATAECLRDGWFRTGDIGHLNQEGFLTITDRAKELIKYKGFQVAPAELEGTLSDHHLVDDVAVIGVRLEDQETEAPRAYIVKKGGLRAVKPGDEEEIMQWLEKRVSNHKRLRGGIKFVESIPKSASGKILRRILKGDVKMETEERSNRENKL